MNLIERVENIILKPKEEWTVISQEDTTVAEVATNYLLVLALIPAVCQLIKYGFIGFDTSLDVHIGASLVLGIRYAAITYISTVLGIFISAYIINMLTANFGSAKDYNKTLQLLVYSFTPAFLAAIFVLIPFLGFLTIVGLYSLYLLYIGMGPMLKTPDNQVTAYFVVSFLVIIAIFVVLSYILGLFFL
jgi:hypothetical protein